MSTTTTTYDEVLARHKKLEAEIFGVPEEKKEVNPFAENAYKNAFTNFLRGEHPKNDLSVGRDESGGYLVPDSLEKQLIEGLAETNVLRTIGTVVKTNHDRKIPVAQEKGEAVWIDENTVIPDSDDSFGQIKIGSFKAATRTRVSEELITDSVFDLEKHIIKEFAKRLGELEEESFVAGNGVGMPLGLLNTTPVGAVTETAGEVTVDDMLNLICGVSWKYRAKGCWLLSEDIERRLRKIRLMNGRPIFEDALETGGVSRFLGYPVLNSNALGEVKPGAKPALFGDFRYFLIADRGRPSFKRLDELYASTGQIGFLATKRVDARLILPEAVKCLQVKE